MVVVDCVYDRCTEPQLWQDACLSGRQVSLIKTQQSEKRWRLQEIVAAVDVERTVQDTSVLLAQYQLPLQHCTQNITLLSINIYYDIIILLRNGCSSYDDKTFAVAATSLVELSSSPTAQSRHHLRTVQTTAMGKPFSGSINIAPCDFWYAVP